MNYQVLSVFVVALFGAHTVVHGNDDVKCENLTFDICRKLDYNRTIFPNYFGHRKQSEAALVVNALDLLMRSGCSRDLLTFVCSVYFPMCTSIDQLIPPCRSLCLDVKTGCEQKLKELYGLAWHKDLQCDQFPTLDKALCVFQNKTAARPTLPTLNVRTTARKNKKVKKVTLISRKLTQKFCPVFHKSVKKSKIECCKCCQRGNRAARANISSCALRKSFIKKEKSIEKTLKECTTRTSKRCYTSCCSAKRNEVLNKKSKTTRRQRTRRNRNKNRRKRPVG